MQDIKKEDIQGVFDGLLKAVGEEARQNPIYAYLEENKDWFGDPETADIMVTGKVRQIFEEVAKRTLASDNFEAVEVFTNWNFYDSHVTRLCERLYGSALSANRGRYIVKAFIKLQTEDVMPDFGEREYWVPETGTPRQWMYFMYGLTRLAWGHPDEYLPAYADLVKEQPEETSKEV